jgi:glycerophosphoryl diester phosphodiesterase
MEASLNLTSTTAKIRILSTSSRPLVYAHRGGAALRPENTIAAFDHGVACGVDGLECDVHLSREGVVVVHHDETLERTTGTRARVADLTADELARLDAGFTFQADGGTTFPFRGAGFGIPRLRDVLRRYPSMRFIIELKTGEPELAYRTIDEVRAASAIDRIALGSFYWRVLNAARTYEPRIATGASQEETRWALYRSWVGWRLRRPKYREFQVPERYGVTTIVTPRFVTYAHRSGLPVKIWTVNTEPDMRRLIDWGADALITDRPDLGVRICRSEPL